MKKGLSVTLTIIGALGCAFLTYPIAKRWYSGGYEVVDVTVGDLLDDPAGYKSRYVRVSDGRVNLAMRAEVRIGGPGDPPMATYLSMIGADPLRGWVAVAFSREEAVDVLPEGVSEGYHPMVFPAVVSVGTGSEKVGEALRGLAVDPESGVVLQYGTKPAGVVGRVILGGVPLALLLWGVWAAPAGRATQA